MRIQQIFIPLLFFFYALNIYSQTDKSLQKVFIPEGYALDRNQVQFNQPEDFTFVNHKTYLECLLAKEWRRRPQCYFSHLLSKDSNFVAYISIPPIYCRRNDSIYAYFDLDLDLVKMNTYHISRIESDFFLNTAKRTTTLFGLPLTYKSSKYACESFNADTVITYPLRMWEKSEDKYTHCLVMLLQKKYRGCIFLYCLYTDKGAKKLNHYIKSLEKVFWYRDPKDYIKVIEPKRDSIFILPKRDIPPGTMVGCLSSSSK